MAAGQGTRLGPFTHSEPKVMIPVGNRPILEYVVSALSENGVRDIVLVVGYQKEKIMTYFEDGKSFDASIEYVVQNKQLGTAHALLQAREKLDKDFIVLPGDNVVNGRTVLDLLEASSPPALVITESETPSKYGVVLLEDDKVIDLVEKPEQKISNLINTGIYSFTSDFLDLCEGAVKRGLTDLPGVLQDFAKRGDITAVTTQGDWIDAVYPWDLLRVNAGALAHLPEGVAGKVEEGVVLRGPISVGKGTVIRGGSYIIGPVAIGEGCDIGPHVTIYPSSSIGSNVTLGPSSFIEESVMMQDSSVGAFSYISRSVVGKGVRAASHLSLPSDVANVQVEGEIHSLEGVGSFLGEDSVLGSGVQVVPGTTLGARCRVSSGVTLRGDIDHGAQVV